MLRWLLTIGAVLCGICGGLLEAGLGEFALHASSGPITTPTLHATVRVWIAILLGCLAAVGALITVADRRTGLLALLIAMVGMGLCSWNLLPLLLLAAAVLLAVASWLPDPGA